MKIIIGVTGSIAAYKSLDLARQLRKMGSEIRFILTSSAQQFVTPLSCQTLSNNDIFYEQFKLTSQIEHIQISKWADIMVIAPATANIIGKIAAGIADDLLTTSVCSFTNPVLIVPAMDENMWRNPIVQENVSKLKKIGYHFLEPTTGELATGKIGKGRFPNNHMIIKKILAVKQDFRALTGKKILISGGSTEENIDPVRVITNRSSGLMASELMYAAYCRGADVLGIFGEAVIIPSELPVERVRSANQMKKKITSKFVWCDCLIMAAAIGDYRPVRKAAEKIHKSSIDLKMVKTSDIIAGLKKDQTKFIIGFSLEDTETLSRARQKLKKKSLDMIVMNTSKALGADRIDARILLKNNKIINCKNFSKWQLANTILDNIPHKVTD